MNDCNFDILKENIRKRMSDKHMTQNDVAKALDTTQANIAKHLKKGDDAQTFTLKQVCQLADLFETSVDELLGRKNTVQNKTPENICSLISVLLENNLIQCVPCSVEEDVWEPDECSPEEIVHHKRNINYCAFYFPEYIPIPKYLPYDEYRFYEQDYEMEGNFNFNNSWINKYLNKFVTAFTDYQRGQSSKEVYKIVVKAYADELKDAMEIARSHSKI